MVDMYRYVSCVKKLKWIQVLSAFCQGCVLRVLGLKFLRIDGSIDAKDFGAKQRVRWRDDEDEMKMKSWFKSWFPHARTRSALVCAWEILRVQDLRLGWLFGVLMILSMGLCIITIIWLDILQYIYIHDQYQFCLTLIIDSSMVWPLRLESRTLPSILVPRRLKMNVAAAPLKHVNLQDRDLKLQKFQQEDSRYFALCFTLRVLLPYKSLPLYGMNLPLFWRFRKTVPDCAQV